MSSQSFSSLSLKASLLSAVAEAGFETMTPIQEKSIPPLLEGRDVTAQSQTGSGKTAAFALPILQNIQLEEKVLQALIMCPTRELSTQVAREIRKLGKKLEGLQVVIVCGGEPLRHQLETLDSGVHIAVGTPGRILDLIDRGRFDLDQIQTLVLDEADKMLEMGFEEQMNGIMSQIPSDRQTALFSATFPDSIQNLSKRYQQNPVKVVIEAKAETANDIEQFVYNIGREDKADILMRVLQQHPAQNTLIFCNQKATVNDLTARISSQSVSCAALHGDLEQKERDRVMATFRNGSTRILVATDVAARGLDIDHLDLVVNFDLTSQVETYVHRIGRTGRAGKKGVAVSLATDNDAMRIFEIEKHFGISMQKPKLGFKNQHGLGALHKESSMQTISISGGRKDKLRAGDILGALTKEGGLKGVDIGKIEVLERSSFVAVSAGLVDQALNHLRNNKIKGQKFQIKIVKQGSK